MNTTVDHSTAHKKLEAALAIANKQGFKPTSPQSKLIEKVISGNHLTFRYILITNILAKSVNPRVHSLALQAKSTLNGAFDSRSLCHKVFVPFERDSLQGKLGKSNEPYLNKPARFTELKSDNPVRKGYDQDILNTTISILNSIKNETEAFNCLADAIYYTLQRNVDTAEVVSVEGNATFHNILFELITELLTKSQEGEICALISGLALNFYGLIVNKDLKVVVHPVNQAGTSSNEVLDIDVYEKSKLIITAEIKDKVFTFEDVDHAANKVAKAGFNSFFFILGPQAHPKDTTYSDLVLKISEKNIKVTFVNVWDFFNTMGGFTDARVDS